MNFFYVLLGGTAALDAGRSTTLRTGSFAAMGASAYYNKIEDVYSIPSTPYAAGDIILLADTHAYVKTDSGSITYYGEESGGSPRAIISVSSSNADTPSPGASEIILSGDSNASYYLRGDLFLFGLTLQPKDNFNSGTTNSAIVAELCTLILTGNSDIMSLASKDGCILKLINSDIDIQDVGGRLNVQGGATLCMTGGRVYNSVGGSINGIFGYGFGGGGGRAHFTGVDLTHADKILYNDTHSYHGLDMRIKNCALKSGVIFTDNLLPAADKRMVITGSSDNAAHSEYQFTVISNGCTVMDQDDSGVHRNDSTPFNSGTKTSLECITSALCSVINPFWFDFPTLRATLTTTGILRIHLASTDTLTGSDIYFTLTYPDGTTRNVSNFLSTRNSNFLTGGTELTADTGSTWKNGAADLTGYNEYYVDIDTSVDVGSDGIPDITAYITKPSVTVNYCPTISLVA
ncbi:MAG: hypothetical protein JKY52_19985 [Flavobacteriales bacterium]|nr:hypothetical protein [Flavobacteriales bacterium]